MEALADDKWIIAKMMVYAFDGVENSVEKGENAGFQPSFSEL